MSKRDQEKKWHSIPTNVAFWYFESGLEFIKRIGVKEGDTVLDFGCNDGDYTIPISHIVGPKGLVYALDMDPRAIDELKNRIAKLGLTNIKLMKTKGELVVNLEDNSLDYIFFYDVIYPLCMDSDIQPFKQLLKEFNRLLKVNGELSMTIVHEEELPFSSDDVIEEANRFFSLDKKFQHEIMVWHRLKNVEILQFRKIR